jgi:hypothetical protein
MDAVILTRAGLEYVEKKLESLNTRADKLGLPRVRLTSEPQLWPVYTIAGKTYVKAPDWVPTGTAEYTGRCEPRYAVTVEGPAPRLAGYDLIARIDHLTDGNIVCKAPDTPELDPKYRSCPATCEHCLVTRRRNSTFLLRSVETGTLTQVGRNCLADYCRDEAAAEGIVSWGSIIETLDRTIREASGLSGGEPLYDCVTLTRAAILCADTFGWVSGAQVRQDETGRLTATSSHVVGVLNPPPPRLRNGGKAEPEEYDAIRTALAEGHRETEAKAVAEWLLTDVVNRDENEVTDYLANLVVAFRSGAVDRRHVGIVVSAFRAHRRETAQADEAARKAANAAALPPQKYIGAVGERLRNLHVRCVLVKSIGVSCFNGRESERFLCKFETIPDGDVVTWFTGENLKYNEGDELYIDASVTKHDEWNGRKQTVVSRVADHKPKPVKKGKANA